MTLEGVTMEMDLAVALNALRKARRLMEANADAAEPSDAATLRHVFSLVLDASAGVAGAHAVVKARRELTEVLAPAAAPVLRVVK